MQQPASSDAEESDMEQETKEQHQQYIPTWSAFNSAIQNQPHQLTRVCVLPIIPTSPTDRTVQVTFFTQLESLTKRISGNNAKCIITLDMGLYKPVQQLIMSQADFRGRWIIRPGELHISFAIIRAIGCFIDGTGIPELWSLLYSEATINSILSGKNFRRSLKAHVRMLVALQKCYFATFFKHHQQLHDYIQCKVQNLCDKFHESTACNALDELKLAIDEYDLVRLKVFDESEFETKPTFMMIRQYMHMVELLLMFVGATRTGNWTIHLATLEQIVKYFFALDLTNYSGTIAWDIAEMYSLKETDPDIWNEFEQGNWIVHRTKTSFCALGCDEALEHQNRAMKVVGGLVGITQHPHALARYFLTAPELQRVAQETLQMAGNIMNDYDSGRHHLDNISAVQKQEKAIDKISQELERVGNPFTYEDSELINLMTKSVFTDDIASDVRQVESLGVDLYAVFKTNRIETASISLWAPIKRNKLRLCSSSRKKIKLDLGGGISELFADRNLFARLLIVTRSQRDVDLAETIGIYEMSTVPRSMFAYDGTMFV